MTCNPKMNYIFFLGDGVGGGGGGGGGFNSSVVRRGSESRGWAVLFFTNDF